MANKQISNREKNLGEIKIIFEYPPQSFKDEEIKGEVRAIMIHALQEQLMLQKSS